MAVAVLRPWGHTSVEVHPISLPDDAGDRRSHLEALHRDAGRRAARLARDFDAVVEAASDVATDDEHDPEGHTIAWERQQLAALLDDAQVARAEIEAALRRLDEESYGLCMRCGREIPAERLEALPATSTCVTCAAGR